jgi:hypothetical protein
MDPDPTAHQTAATSNQDECDDPRCACHSDTGYPLPGEGAAEVTMTEVYDIEIPWGHHPSGW